jgi:hypothetical protein
MYAFIASFAVMLGALIGKLADPNFRCRQMRRFLHKEYQLYEIVSKDHMSINQKIMNAEMDYVTDGTFAWITKEHRVYRMSIEDFSGVKNAEDFDKALKNSTTWFKPSKKNVKWREGVPTVFVDRDNVKPLSFFEEKTNVKPDELAAANTTYLAVERKKDQVNNQTGQILIILILLAAVIGAYFGYQAYGNTQVIMKGVVCSNPVSSALPAGATVENGAIKINAGGK